MPCTKQRPKKRLASSVQDLIEEYKKKANCTLMLLHQRGQRTLAALDNIEQSLLASYSEADLKKTVKQLREENRLREDAKKQNSAKDEGYVTEANGSSSSSAISLGGHSSRHLQPPKSIITKPLRRLSRSLSRSTTKNMTSTTTSSGMSSMGPPSTYRGRHRRSSSTSALSKPMYRTPANNRMANFPPITPKVGPNTPMTVLRRPRKGEMILSMSGSPLLPGSGVDEMPSCNIPLEDGTLLSLVPHKIRKSQFQLPVEYMAPETYHQLALLRNNIDVVCNAIKKQNQSN